MKGIHAMTGAVVIVCGALHFQRGTHTLPVEVHRALFEIHTTVDDTHTNAAVKSEIVREGS